MASSPQPPLPAASGPRQTDPSRLAPQIPPLPDISRRIWRERRWGLPHFLPDMLRFFTESQPWDMELCGASDPYGNLCPDVLIVRFVRKRGWARINQEETEPEQTAFVETPLEYQTGVALNYSLYMEEQQVPLILGPMRWATCAWIPSGYLEITHSRVYIPPGAIRAMTDLRDEERVVDDQLD